MTSINADAPFAEANDVDQGLITPAAALNPGLQASSGAKLPHVQINYDSENAPLLSQTVADYGREDGVGSEHGETEWLGMADFRGLPWWKRPSVSSRNLEKTCSHTDITRLTGSFPLSSFSVLPLVWSSCRS